MRTSEPERTRRGGVDARRVTRVAVTIGLGALVAPATGSAEIRGYLSDLVPAADGTARVTAVSRDRHGRSAVVESALGADGAVVGSRLVIPRDPRQTSAVAALTGNGVVGAYAVRGRKRSVVRAVAWGPGGLLGRAQTVSDTAHGAGLVGAYGGANGAMAVVFKQGYGRSTWRDMIALRPAGATRFARAVPLNAKRRASFGSDLPEDIRIAFAPDGSSVVVLGPNGDPGSLRARRISAAGELGKVITVAKGEFTVSSSAVTIGPSGTAVMAFRALPESGYAYSLITSTLPAGASAATPAQRLGDGGNPSDDDPDFALTVGPGDQTSLVSGEAKLDHLTVYEGPATALVRTGTIPAFVHSGAWLVPTADGGLTAAWVGSPVASHDRTGLVSDRIAVFAAHRPPGGAWTPPTALTTPVDEESGPVIGGLMPLPGAGTRLFVETATSPTAVASVGLLSGP